MTCRRKYTKISLMSTVFFDLEWNQGYPRSEADKIDEILQIGAYRLHDWQDSGDAFSAWVKPTIHKKLHHQVKKLVPMEQAELKKAGSFRKVAGEFFRWCGKDASFFTWGTCDARVLDTNLCWYGMEQYLDLEIYDLQRAFDLLVLKTVHQTSLEAAVSALGLESQMLFHDAGNDAHYTALIGAELVRRFGALPSEAELDRIEHDLREVQRLEAASLARGDLDILLQEEQPVISRRCGSFADVRDGLKSRSARIYHCPECDGLLCSGNWYQLDNYYVSRSRCGEHGKFLGVMTFREDRLHRHQGQLCVYPEEVLPDDLFRLCRQGGRRIEVNQIPRKHRRPSSSRRRRKPDQKNRKGENQVRQ